jgi:hypothetical protein
VQFMEKELKGLEEGLKTMERLKTMENRMSVLSTYNKYQALL